MQQHNSNSYRLQSKKIHFKTKHFEFNIFVSIFAMELVQNI